jgi:hypothetical protein
MSTLLLTREFSIGQKFYTSMAMKQIPMTRDLSKSSFRPGSAMDLREPYFHVQDGRIVCCENERQCTPIKPDIELLKLKEENGRLKNAIEHLKRVAEERDGRKRTWWMPRAWMRAPPEKKAENETVPPYSVMYEGSSTLRLGRVPRVWRDAC